MRIPLRAAAVLLLLLGESAPRLLFAAPPPRRPGPIPSGREVVLEVESVNRAGLAERIAEAAARRGGKAVPRPAGKTAPGSAEAAEVVGVLVPSSAAKEFLADLSKLGTIPPGGLPGPADFPAGPSPGVVSYTIRIRVR